MKDKKIRSVAHRKFISEQPCIITGSTYNIQCHHLLKAGGKGMATKACDSLTVPLTSFMHNMLHRNGNEIAFFANHGLDYEIVKAFAKQFASLSPDKKISNL